MPFLGTVHRPRLRLLGTHAMDEHQANARKCEEGGELHDESREENLFRVINNEVSWVSSSYIGTNYETFEAELQGLEKNVTYSWPTLTCLTRSKPNPQQPTNSWAKFESAV
jgi:hypothetical protein